jgi:hypothetical protein
MAIWKSSVSRGQVQPSGARFPTLIVPAIVIYTGGGTKSYYMDLSMQALQAVWTFEKVWLHHIWAPGTCTFPTYLLNRYESVKCPAIILGCITQPKSKNHNSSRHFGTIMVFYQFIYINRPVLYYLSHHTLSVIFFTPGKLAFRVISVSG